MTRALHFDNKKQQTNPSNCFALFIMLSIGMSACSAPRAAEREASTPPTSQRADQQPTPARPSGPPMGPRTPTADEGFDAIGIQAGANGSKSSGSEVQSSDRETRIASPRVPNGARDDGRPNWWFSETRRADGMLRLCTESLGADMAAARLAALVAARAKVRTELGLTDEASIPGEMIEFAWVWPLPNSRVGPSRYAGYVLIAAAAESAE